LSLAFQEIKERVVNGMLISWLTQRVPWRREGATN
jgi:hypothetical protein